MPRYFLTRLAVEGFRGINNENAPLDIKFEPNSVNSVFAVNGNGKSSIFEALYYAIHGTIPKLDLLQASEQPQNYYCNRFHSRNTASILVELQPDDGTAPVAIQIDRDAQGTKTVNSPSGHANPEGFLATLKEAFALLDYRTFTRFIEESPLKRGRTFSALLGLAEYSDCRQAFKTATDTRALNADLDIGGLSADANSAEQAAQQALAILGETYEKVTGKALADISKIDESTAEVATALANVELLRPLLVGKTLDEIDFNEIKAVITAAEGGAKRQELAEAIKSIAALKGLAVHDVSAIAKEQREIGELIDERDRMLSLTRGDLFRLLYESARDLISQATWTDEKKCPLCESELSSSITEHISKQLAQYTGAAEKLAEIENKWKRGAWKKCLAAYESSDTLAVRAEDRLSMRVEGSFRSGNIPKSAFTAAVGWTSDLRRNATSALKVAETRKDALEEELPPSLVQLTVQVESARQFKDALKVYQVSEKKEAEKRALISIRERWKQFIVGAATCFAEAEAALSRARINGIDTEYKSLFREIMQVGDVVPELRRTENSENLHVQLSDFHGQHNLSAGALLSESYRNALAISVFLAAALKHSGTPRFVVLDDVTSSFDAGHQYYLMEVMRSKLQQPQNSNGLQFIVLSHDSLLEKYFDRLDGTSEWNHNKLQGLPPTGAVLPQAQGADRLKNRMLSLLSAGQVTEATPLIRQYLEYKLQQIIRRVDIPVPIDFAIKDTSRVVSRCLDAIRTSINLHKSAGTLVLDAQQVRDVENSHVPAIVGNWVSHYETGSGSSLSAPMLRGVIGSIDALTECFRYDDTSSGSTVRKWYRALDSR